MVRPKITIGFLSILLVALAVMFVGTFPRNSMRAMQRLIPQAVEVFEQSRASLRILRDGEFVANNALTFRLPDRLIIFCRDRGGVFYPDWYWHAIEWLSNEEREAIIFLLASDALEHNFIEVGPTRATLYTTSTQVGAAMTILYPGVDPLTSSEFPLMEDTYIVDLEDGYRLWLYTWRDPSIGTDFGIIINTTIRLIILMSMVIVSRQLILISRKLYRFM